MSSQNFVNGVTLTAADWFNDVDSITYDGATTKILVGGGAGTIAAWTTATGSGSPVRATAPTFTTSMDSGTSFTAFAGATTLLTIGGTGATSVVAIPGTLEWSGTTGALTVAGGVYIAKKLKVAGALNIGEKLFTVDFTATAGLLNTVATTLFSLSGKPAGIYLVYFDLQPASDGEVFADIAIISYAGGAAANISEVGKGSLVSLSLSTLNVQVAQFSGSTNAGRYTYLKIL